MGKSIEFAAKALIINNDHFLAMHKVAWDADLYELPGGRAEFGETPEQTLVREIREETGLIVRPIKLLDTWTYIADSFQVVGVFYLCTAEGEVKLSVEHDRCRWLPADGSSVDAMVDWFSNRMMHWDWDQIKHIAP